MIGKVSKDSKKIENEHIHITYKKIISNIIRNVEEKEMQRELDFKIFVSSLANKRNELSSRLSLEAKGDRSRRKSKNFGDKDDGIEL